MELTVELAEAPALEEGEWWAQELEGCEVVDGERHRHGESGCGAALVRGFGGAAASVERREDGRVGRSSAASSCSPDGARGDP